jgi:hypothetical protein
MTILDSAAVSATGLPADIETLPLAWRTGLPDYCDLLACANGLALRGGLFRLFGVGSGCLGRDGATWNRASWREAYELAPTMVVWGENIFGDQYGTDLRSGAMARVCCEGGRLDLLAFETPIEYLERVLLGDPRLWIESELVGAAANRGLLPSLSEHLSFVLPLMCGGSVDAGNLEVMEAEAHLDLLGQILKHSKGIPEGTRIREFRG